MNEFPEPTSFERSLSTVALPIVKLDRDMLFYEAGRMAATRERSRQQTLLGRYGWPSSFAAMTTVAALLLAIVLAQSGNVATSVGTVSHPLASNPSPELLTSPRESESSGGSIAAILKEARDCDRVAGEGVDAPLPVVAASLNAPHEAGTSLFCRESLDEFLRDR